MDFEKVNKEFWKNGYVIFENFFEGELMDDYNQKVLDHFATNPESELNDEFSTKSAVQVVPWFPYKEGKPYFDGVNKHQLFNDITTAILKEAWENLYCMMMFSKAGSIGQAWHQDSPPENKKKYNLNRLVYTHDINEETGGQVVIYPGTHNNGALTIGKPHEDLEGQLEFSPKKGTIVFLHGHCWHRVKPVKKDRISSNFRAVPKDTPEDITDICVYRNMRYRFSTEEVILERN